MKQLLFSIALCLLLVSCGNRHLSKNRCTVVLSMDAFRHDYPELAHLPTLDSLKRVGVFAHSLPPFPTLTFPSHYAMATGLYPDHHGIVNNTFVDPVQNKMFRISDREAVSNPEFWKGEPIWTTVQKSGLSAYVFHWVGSETSNQGIRPDRWFPYSNDYTYTQKADSVLSWLARPKKERPNLIMFYFDEPDHTSHDAGAASKETLAKTEELDRVLNYFFTKVRQNKANKDVNFIVTSDHGMADFTKDRYINLSKYVDTTKIEQIIFSNPMMLLPKEGQLDALYSQLKKVEHITVYKRDEFPAEFHYGTNDRIWPLVILPETGYRLDISKTDRPRFGGNHGYDPRDKQMHAIFYAVGPDFKKGVVGNDFPNVDIYALIAHLLRITPAPNDGNLNDLKPMLKR